MAKVHQNTDRLIPATDTDKDKLFEILIIVILLCFGTYHSVLYFGHMAVPNPDFPDFANTGHKLLSFQLPKSFKRAPVVGILQVSCGYLIGGQTPDLTGARVVDAILHPLSIVLLWLVGRKLVGKAALWLAIIAGINPWLIQFVTESAAETILLFFVLLTFYFIFKRSSWSYLFASITTMVRYEGAALILAAFVIDMITRKTAKQRIRAFVYAVLASVPLGLWMLATFLHWQTQTGGYYLKELGYKSGGKIVLFEYIRTLWEATFGPLFIPVPSCDKTIAQLIFTCSKITAAATFFFGCCYGLYKRHWNILAMLIFFVPYMLIHAIHAFVFHRVCTTVHWIALLICFYGIQSCWKLINSKKTVPQPVVWSLQSLILIIAVLWLWQLLPFLPKLVQYSRRSVSFPYVTIAVLGLIFVWQLFIYRKKDLLRNIVILAIVCLMVVSNQFVLVKVVRNGQRSIEFKYLADWYLENAKPGEKMVSSMAHILRILAQRHKGCFLAVNKIGGDNPTEFTKNCYDKGITYVTWDSRMGFNTKSRYYKVWKMKNIAMLARPRNIGPYELITQLGGGKGRGFINVFRLRQPPAAHR